MISFFKIIFLPFHFLWRSSLSSLKSIARTYQSFHREQIEPSLKPDDQQVLIKNDSSTTTTFSTLKKLTATVSIAASDISDTKQQYPLSFDIDTESFCASDDESRPCSPISDVKIEIISLTNEQSKVKGILRNSIKSQHFLTSTEPLNSNNQDRNQSEQNPSSPTSPKHVTFNEKILRKKYKPNEPVSSLQDSAKNHKKYITFIELNESNLDEK